MTLKNKIILFEILLSISVSFWSSINAQTIYKIEREDSDILFFDKNISQYTPHIVRMYQRGRVLHNQVWNSDSTGFVYHAQKPVMYLTDWNDDGNGGVSVLPTTTVGIGMAPLNFSYYTAPSVERYNHLFNHEYTHVVMADKYAGPEYRWRSFFGTKVAPDARYPISAFWSYLTVPRWYSPRWYHEGIACFMETWFGGGVGRALGGYDEMFFRSIVRENEPIFSVVGLETEGTTQDFQQGTNSYLYGTRFVNYLAYKYGVDSLFRFYNRTPDSRLYFSRQFTSVYGKSLREEWEQWKKYEAKHQNSNLGIIEEYPLTETEPLSEKPLGAMSAPVFDSEKGVIYAAVNYPGVLAQVVSIDIKSGKRRKLMLIDGPMSRQTAYVALDTNHGRLFVTDHNLDIRGFRVYDLKKGRVVATKEFTRMSNLVYDNARNRLYGIISNAGVSHIAYYDEDLKTARLLYSFNFGKSITDLDVSHDGHKLSVTILENGGEQTLALFDVDKLENARFEYEELAKMDDTNLGMFRFSLDDSSLIGSSYYTGVSNLWKIDVASKEMTMLSNTPTGLFSPVQVSRDSLVALEFARDGMIPVRLAIHQVNDANAIEFLGQHAFERNPSLATISEVQDSSLLEVAFADVYDNIQEYKPLREIRFAGAYPDISGFTDTAAFNSVTPVLGYRFLFQDKIGLNRLNFHVGISPWSHNDWKHKIHASVDWQLWNWNLNAYYNGTNFYDLLGPFRTSRQGYKVGLKYSRQNFLFAPLKWKWEAGVATYGGLDRLPLFQDVSVDSGIKSLQTAQASAEVSKLRTSFGGVMPEQGYRAKVQAYTYFAGGNFYPSALVEFDAGLMLPFVRNTSFWLRSAVGNSFGESSSAFGNEYFGGFRNNYIDWQDSYRYREVNAMPGAAIDGIEAHNFAKVTAELNLKPLRFNNLGFLGLYPTYAQLTLFSTDLVANPWGSKALNNFNNIGAQLNVEVVLFSYLKTTWSVGYAYLFHTYGASPVPASGEWMISLKLL